MTANGQPDGSRGARVILKHYVQGRLLFCIAPPEVDQAKFHSYPPPEENRATKIYTPFEKILLKVLIFIIQICFVENENDFFFSQMLLQDQI